MVQPVSLVEFQVKRALLARKPLKDKKELLLSVGAYYQETLGSEIDGRYILETERFMKELYLKAWNEGVSQDIQNSIIEAGGLASELSYAIKTKNLDHNYFANATRLGVALMNIGHSIPE